MKICENCGDPPPEGSQQRICASCYKSICVMCWGVLDGDLCGKCQRAREEKGVREYKR